MAGNQLVAFSHSNDDSAWTLSQLYVEDPAGDYLGVNVTERMIQPTYVAYLESTETQVLDDVQQNISGPTQNPDTTDFLEAVITPPKVDGFFSIPIHVGVQISTVGVWVNTNNRAFDVTPDNNLWVLLGLDQNVQLNLEGLRGRSAVNLRSDVKHPSFNIGQLYYGSPTGNQVLEGHIAPTDWGSYPRVVRFNQNQYGFYKSFQYHGRFFPPIDMFRSLNTGISWFWGWTQPFRDYGSTYPAMGDVPITADATYAFLYYPERALRSGAWWDQFSRYQPGADAAL